MGIIAVAGGLGDVGRTIVEEILDSKIHQVYILTRKVI
jgi:NAD dependent epimerase/dehydratase family enzyme